MHVTLANTPLPSLTVRPRPNGSAAYTMIGAMSLDDYVQSFHSRFRLGGWGIFGHVTIAAILIIGEIVTGTGVLFMLSIPSLATLLLQSLVQKQWYAFLVRRKHQNNQQQVLAALQTEHMERQALAAEEANDPYLAATAEWHEYVTMHDQIKEKIWDAETDWNTIFYYPAINDHMVPETQDLIMAQTVAQSTSATLPKQLTANTVIADLPYPKAVLALQKAWNIAWANAQKIAQSNLTDDERKTIKRIITLLRKVEDGAATESEKIVAYDRVDILLKDLRNVTIPERTKALLAAERRHALTAGSVNEEPHHIALSHNEQGTDAQYTLQDGTERPERDAQRVPALNSVADGRGAQGSDQGRDTVDDDMTDHAGVPGSSQGINLPEYAEKF